MFELRQHQSHARNFVAASGSSLQLGKQGRKPAQTVQRHLKCEALSLAPNSSQGRIEGEFRFVHFFRFVRNLSVPQDRGGRNYRLHKCADPSMVGARRPHLQAVRDVELGFQPQRRSLASHVAVLHDDDAVTERLGLVKKMRCDNGHPARTALLKQLPELPSRQDVHPGGMFVQDQKGWVSDEGHGEAKFSLLASAEVLCQFVMLFSRQAYLVEQAVGVLLDTSLSLPPFLPHALDAGHETHVLFAGQILVDDVVRLRNEPCPVPQLINVSCDVHVIHGSRPRARGGQPHQHADKGRFACPIMAKKAHNLTVRGIESNAVIGCERLRLGGPAQTALWPWCRRSHIDLCQALHLQCRTGRFLIIRGPPASGRTIVSLRRSVRGCPSAMCHLHERIVPRASHPKLGRYDLVQVPGQDAVECDVYNEHNNATADRETACCQ
mmetsp:Transcript_9976/g.30448  ORF Transcript_9976/g.30448 Transcript_9976/m.30448 type:complete len:438 (+) Transcript_9976:2481-3794(+)